MSWVHYLGTEHFETDTVFLDADIVLNRQIDEVFDNDFALAFASVPSPKTYSRINTGVIFAKKAEQKVAHMHAQKLLLIAEDLRLVKEPRFPQFQSAGVWGVDEMCVNVYLNELARAKNSTLPEVAESIKFEEFRSFDDGISLFGPRFNADYRYLEESEWTKPSVLHFPGQPKPKLFEYCKNLQ